MQITFVCRYIDLSRLFYKCSIKTTTRRLTQCLLKTMIKETIVRDIAHYCASRQNSLKLECICRNHERKQQLRRRCRNRCSRSWDKWQVARSLEAHRRRDIIQSLYLLVFQRSHSRFNSRYVYCHSVVIFPLKFSLDNKKLRRANEAPSVVGKLHTAARGSIALNKFVLRDRAAIHLSRDFICN